MKAMILAAGLGTRLRPVTDHLAKPAVPFLNVPLLFYPLALLQELGLDGLVINTHHRPEQIEKLASQIPGADLEVAFSLERDAPLGSGGGIWKAHGLLEGYGDFVVANGDEVILPRDKKTMANFLAAHKKASALGTLLVMKHPGVGTQFGGVWTLPNGQVLGFGKDGSAFSARGATGHHYVGVLLLSDRVFKYLPKGESNILYDALTKGIAAGETVQAHLADLTWYETGNPHDFLQATDAALELLTSKSKSTDGAFLKALTKSAWDKGTKVEKSESLRLIRHPNSLVDSSASLSGFVVLGDGSRIESGATVQDCVLLPGAVVAASKKIKGEIVLPSV